MKVKSSLGDVTCLPAWFAGPYKCDPEDTVWQSTSSTLHDWNVPGLSVRCVLVPTVGSMTTGNDVVSSNSQSMLTAVVIKRLVPS